MSYLNLDPGFNPDVVEVQYLLDLVENGDLLLEDSVIQRRSIATPKWRSELIRSLIQGRSINVIHIAPHPTKQGKLMCVDGRQRLETIIDFFRNRVQIPVDVTAKVNHEGENEDVRITGETKLRYRNLVREGKEEVLNCLIKKRQTVIMRYGNVTPNEIHLLFTYLNNGNDLKNQEKLNAFPSILGKNIRTLARGIDISNPETGEIEFTQGHHELFSGQSSPKFIPDLLKISNLHYIIDEIVSKMFYYEVNGLPNNDGEITASMITNLYVTTQNYNVEEYSNSNLQAIQQTVSSKLDIIHNLISKSGAVNCNFQKKSNDLLYLYIIISELQRQDYAIDEPQVFLDAYLDCENKIMMIQDTTTGKTIRSRAVKGNTLVRAFVGRLLQGTVSHINGLVHVERGIEFNDDTLKEKIWLQQNRKCAYSGNEISLKLSKLVPIVNREHGGNQTESNAIVVDSDIDQLRNGYPWFDFLIEQKLTGIEGDALPPLSLNEIKTIQNQLYIDESFKDFLQLRINQKVMQEQQ